MAAGLLPMAAAPLSLHSLAHTHVFSTLILLSHNASIYRHFMAAVLALLSTLVAAKLQLIQQWWLPTFDILDGCTCNGNNPTITPFAIHVGQLSSCFFSTGLHLAALPSLPF
jgi:hypothetical protein